MYFVPFVVKMHSSPAPVHVPLPPQPTKLGNKFPNAINHPQADIP